MFDYNDWWLNSFYDNFSNVVPYTVTSNPPQTAINEYGSGLLDIINKAPIRYGDDIDVIQTSYTGLPKFADKHEAYVYVVQYKQSINNTTNNAPAKIVPRIR